MLASLYSDKDSYSSRSNKFLKEDINSNIERIKELDPIDLIMINDKYYIKSDGHHRVYYLIMCLRLLNMCLWLSATRRR